jgi:hypothetical protein
MGEQEVSVSKSQERDDRIIKERRERDPKHERERQCENESNCEQQ